MIEDLQIQARSTEAAERFGFRYGSKGAHTSRTIMLDEIGKLLSAVASAAPAEDYTLATV